MDCCCISLVRFPTRFPSFGVEHHRAQGNADQDVAAVGADSATVVAGTTYLRWFVPALAIQFALAAMGAAEVNSPVAAM